MGTRHPPRASAAQLDAAETFERLLVPAVGLRWAARLARLAEIKPTDRVLDIACGTGVVAREALSRVGGRGSVVALDANPGMLQVASHLATDVEYCLGVAESLPFPDRTFEVVLCQFGLPFFGDRAKALLEMRRVLRTGGRSVSVVWDEIGTAPAFDRLAPILERVAGQRAALAFRAPFALGRRDALIELLASSGARQSQVSTEQSSASFLSVRSFVEAELRGWLPVMGVELQEDQLRGVLVEAEERLRDLVAPDGRLEFEMSAHVVTMPGGR